MSRSSARRSALAFVALTYLFSWGVVVPAALLTSSVPAQFAAVTVSAFGPLAAAVVLTWRSDRSVGGWFRETLAWRVSPWWYLAAVAVPLLGVVVQSGVYAAVVGPVDLSVLPRRLGLWLGSLPVALLLTGGNEEFGWRGYLLAHLQQSRSALRASLLVGLAWLVWHLPSDLLLTALGGGLSWPMGRLAMRLAIVPLAVILTWLYNNSRGSVLPAMVLHAGWNTVGILVPAPHPAPGAAVGGAPTATTLQVTAAAFVTVVAIAIVAVAGPGTLSRRGKHRWPVERKRAT